MALTQKLDDISSRMKGYYEYLPDGYDPAKEYPVLIALHGQGELGSGDAAALAKLVNNAPIKYLSTGKVKFPGIVVAPQLIGWGQASDVRDLLAWARKKYKIKEDQKYLCGLSMGGGTAWNTLSDAIGKEFAAAVIVCGAERPTAPKAGSIAANGVAVWGFHNQGDSTVAPSNTVQWVSMITSAKGEAKATLWPGGGHDAWSKAFDPAYTEDGDNWMQFLLRHSRGGVIVTPPVDPPKPDPVPPVITMGTVNTIIVFPYPVSLIAQVKGTAPTFLWEQVSGPSAVIKNPASLETEAALPSIGSYVFKITATDNGATATATLTYNVV